ncbi:MAG: hypothetical protein ACREAC_05975, partial [Blastocatellia bacterium]
MRQREHKSLSGGTATLTLAVLLTVAAVCSQASAQTESKPDRGTGGIGSYSISDFETVNLGNGNVNLSIPLASLPPIAGGKLGWTLRAEYNSKLWDTVTQELPAGPGAPPVPQTTLQFTDLSNFGGWRIGEDYTLAIHNATDFYKYVIPTSQTDPDFAYLTTMGWFKALLTTPDGTQHELRPVDFTPFPGARDFLRGYYSQTPDNTGKPMRYYSFDGSNIWAKYNPSGGSTLWTLFLPDGTTVSENQNGSQVITDPNGNKLQISSTVDSSGVATKTYQDVLTGRQISYVFGGVSGTQ